MQARNPFLPACLAIILAALSHQAAFGKAEHLLPVPKNIAVTEGATCFKLGRPIALRCDSSCLVLDQFIKTFSRGKGEPRAMISVRFVDDIQGSGEKPLAGYQREAYSLRVSADTVEILALNLVSLTRAAQTLWQLSEGWESGEEALEPVSITDWPAFPVRGFMHDCGRSYIDTREILHEIDLLSRFKVNTFHFHLTENQAWRMQIIAYPQLTAAETMARDSGRVYTQDECTNIERYARARGITVIPEIDMPGHSEAFERAMGHAMQTEEGKTELKRILAEVAAAFPLAPYIHIGADEQQITDPTFLPEMAETVRRLGRKVVVWNPIRGVDIAAQDFCDMTQMWSTAGKFVPGKPNIDCRYNYINHFDCFADLVGIYKSNIYYQQAATDEAVGTITAVWNDRPMPSQSDILRQNNFYACVLASAERAWKGGGEEYIEQGGVTLPPEGSDVFKEFADWERRFLFHKGHSLADEPIPYVKQTNVRWLITDAFPNGGQADIILPPDTLGPQPYFVLGADTFRIRQATGAAVYLRHTWGGIVPAFFSDPQIGSTAYAWTFVYSPREQTAGALVEFQNYSRSEAAPAPFPSQWDRKGSRLWLNDEELLPPEWLGDPSGASREQPLLNENFSARKPLEVRLRKGWNKVFLKLPYVPAPGVRLNKWMFTFVLTDPEGRNALEGITYDPAPSPPDFAE
ncbi:MAG: family 20 glycosylhydrolase [Prevotellaceae bacterium]|nr:family 20 glycosylhydrolase [Prevotellaceae bacterium]